MSTSFILIKQGSLTLRKTVETELESIISVSPRVDLSKIEIDMTYIPSTNLPERNLLAAVLARAVLDLSSAERVIASEARGFFLSDLTAEDPFSFRWLCAELDLDADIFLTRLFGPNHDEVVAVWEPYRQRYKGGRRLPRSLVFHPAPQCSSDTE